MNCKTRFIFVCFIIMSLTHISSSANAGTYAMCENRTDSVLVSADGPYVLYQEDGGTRIITVDHNGELRDTTYNVLPDNYELPVISSNGKHSFKVPFHSIQRPSWKYNKSRKVFVMSDPHGNIDCFVSLLKGNNVIDDNLNWRYGNNHLVIIGDIFDRGDDVVPILWLVYKLEQEALQAGGYVSFLLGNHESMVLANDLRYCTEKYKVLADKLGVPYTQLFGRNSELGKWLATRNTIQIIGNDLYVHAGLSKEFYEMELSIPVVNEEMSKVLFLNKKDRKSYSALSAFLYGNSGPIWYRGLVRSEEKYNPLTLEILELILKRYNVKKIIVGHTIFDDISTFYNGKVIDVNVNNLTNKENKKGRGIIIKNNRYKVIGDSGVQRKL